MFSVIYSLEVKEGQVENFKDAWEDLTRSIYKFEGSLGSRLHRAKELEYIAYAQWPEKSIWANSGNRLPNTAKVAGTRMKESCEKIETIFELEVVADLLQNEVKN